MFKSLYSIKLYIGITISIFWVLSTCVLFISVMQSVKEVQFSNIAFLFTAAPAANRFGTFIAPLRSM